LKTLTHIGALEGQETRNLKCDKNMAILSLYKKEYIMFIVHVNTHEYLLVELDIIKRHVMLIYSSYTKHPQYPRIYNTQDI